MIEYISEIQISAYDKEQNKEMLNVNMEILRYISGPVIGAVIGYFTNYIAVKMLFYPRHEIKFHGHVLPFTPGAIPKGKERLAKSVGKVVANELLTKDDLERLLLSEEIENRVISEVSEHLSVPLNAEICKITAIDEEKYKEKKGQLCTLLSDKIIKSIDVYDLMDDQGADYFKEKAHGKAIGLIMTDKMIERIANFLAGELQKVVDDKGVSYVQPIVEEKMNDLDESTPAELLYNFGLDDEKIRSALTDAYRRFISENIEPVMLHINVAEMITEKINAMPIEKVETLVINMMKKELGTIVNLGAVIGFVLGLVNLLTSMI